MQLYEGYSTERSMSVIDVGLLITFVVGTTLIVCGVVTYIRSK